jgi:hypothetical protein
MIQNALDMEYLRERRERMLAEADHERRLRELPGDSVRLALALPALGLLTLAVIVVALSWL